MGWNWRMLRWQCTGGSWICCWMCCWFEAECVDDGDVVYWWIAGVFYSGMWWISKVAMWCCNYCEQKSWKLHCSCSGGGGML